MFNYIETASDRAGIGALSERLAAETRGDRGASGGAVRTCWTWWPSAPVREIRLFDRDEFLQHNAFRAPGAPTLGELRDVPLKVDYFRQIYARMHRHIVAHPTFVRGDNLYLLDGVTFAFLCMDRWRGQTSSCRATGSDRGRVR